VETFPGGASFDQAAVRKMSFEEYLAIVDAEPVTKFFLARIAELRCGRTSGLSEG
jgi:hypothetical protein